MSAPASFPPKIPEDHSGSSIQSSQDSAENKRDKSSDTSVGTSILNALSAVGSFLSFPFRWAWSKLTSSSSPTTEKTADVAAKSLLPESSKVKDEGDLKTLPDNPSLINSPAHQDNLREPPKADPAVVMPPKASIAKAEAKASQPVKSPPSLERSLGNVVGNDVVRVADPPKTQEEARTLYEKLCRKPFHLVHLAKDGDRLIVTTPELINYGMRTGTAYQYDLSKIFEMMDEIPGITEVEGKKVPLAYTGDFRGQLLFINEYLISKNRPERIATNAGIILTLANVDERHVK